MSGTHPPDTLLSGLGCCLGISFKSTQVILMFSYKWEPLLLKYVSFQPYVLFIGNTHVQKRLRQILQFKVTFIRTVTTKIWVCVGGNKTRQNKKHQTLQRGMQERTIPET